MNKSQKPTETFLIANTVNKLIVKEPDLVYSRENSNNIFTFVDQTIKAKIKTQKIDIKIDVNIIKIVSLAINFT